MQVEIIGVFIPIIFLLVSGLIVIAAIYYRSRERQMLIEKGLSAEQIREFFKDKIIAKKDSYILLQVGIISVFFGIGIGIGLMLEDWTSKDYWNVLFIFTFTGAGFIVANLVAKKLSNGNKEK
ncbi:MAG: DUF6249 domain-containing protein [Ignavibacteriales bacterium]|nr:DUF6249 domain-containing protein [Ignavibacteriales bacterium]